MKSLSQRVWLGLLLLPLLSVNSAAQSDEEPPSDWTITLDVEQVLLTVAVRDRAGRHVPDLEQSAFQVYEDGKRQRLEYFSRQDIPVTVGLLIDNSRSMRSKHSEVLAAASAFIQGSHAGDEMFIVNFNERARFGLPNSLPFTADPQLLRQALASVVLDGQTALYDAIGLGLDHLEQGSRDKDVLLVISDGGDNASRLRLKDLLARIERTSVMIYTIGVYDDANADRNLPALKKIARASGGAAYFPSRVADIVGVCKEIANDIRSQYTIAYRSANTGDDVSFRRIRVTAKSPEGRKLRVRTRPGYSRKPVP